MNKCKQVKHIISDYLENQLNPDQKELIENHLAECNHCAIALEGIKNLKNTLKTIRKIKTSPDFDTVLRTRIKIESGIGRRLHKIVWTWPARIPIYGMSVALIVIAAVLVFEQIKKPGAITPPDPYVNTKWYGGNPQQNSSPPIFKTDNNVIYVIDRMSPQDILKNEKNYLNTNDSINNFKKDSLLNINNNKIKQVNQIY